MAADANFPGLSIKRASDPRYFSSCDEILHLLRAEALTTPSKNSSSAFDILSRSDSSSTNISSRHGQASTFTGSRSQELEPENVISYHKDKCIVCGKSFGFLKRRKHTCRLCARVTCSQCAVDHARRNPDANSCSFCECEALKQDLAHQSTSKHAKSPDTLTSDKRNGCRAVYLGRKHNHQMSMMSKTAQRTHLLTQKSHLEPIMLLSTSEFAILGHESSSKSRR